MSNKTNLEKRAARKRLVEQNRKNVKTGCGGCTKKIKKIK